MEIKWIKITTDLFDNRKIKQIGHLDNGDTIIVLWLRLLIMAAETNDDGFIYLIEGVPYQHEDLAIQFNKTVEEVQEALDLFKNYKMIEITNGFIRISNWEKYQNIDGLEKIREQTRKRVADYRERRKICNVTERYNVTHGNATDKEEEKEGEKEKEVKKAKKPVKETQLAMFDSLISNFVSISEPLKDSLREWIEYKAQIKKPYVESGMKSFLKKVSMYEGTYGTSQVISLIEYSMSNNYQGVIWDRLSKDNSYKGNKTQKSMLDDLADFANSGGMI